MGRVAPAHSALAAGAARGVGAAAVRAGRRCAAGRARLVRVRADAGSYAATGSAPHERSAPPEPRTPASHGRRSQGAVSQCRVRGCNTPHGGRERHPPARPPGCGYRLGYLTLPVSCDLCLRVSGVRDCRRLYRCRLAWSHVSRHMGHASVSVRLFGLCMWSMMCVYALWL